MSFSAIFEPGVNIESQHWVIAVVAQRLVLRKCGGQLLHRYQELTSIDRPIVNIVHLGLWCKQTCFVVEYSAENESEGIAEWDDFSSQSLRSQLDCLTAEEFALAGRALQLVHWLQHHRFCGRCGAGTHLLSHERALQCNRCETLYYPRIAPCVIGIVIRGQQCLLARNARFAEGLFSVIAGFIEPGETAEAALQREVMEEVGLPIENLEYVTSQSWPFPSQLMLGFIAHNHEGEIRVDGEEIVEAAWFGVDNLPNIPPPKTISGQLIQTFLRRQRN